MKSLKKALAAFLAVLMVVFSVPFTALAAAGDKPNVHLTAYDAYVANGTLCWGPEDDVAYEPLTGTIEEGSHFVLTWTMTGCTDILTIGIDGKYDTTKFYPTWFSVNKKGVVTWSENTDGSAFVAGAENLNVQADGETTRIQDGHSQMVPSTGRFMLSKVVVGGTKLSGNTYFEEGYLPEEEDWGPLTIPGTMIAAVLLTATEDLDADNLYQYFTFDLTNLNLNEVYDSSKNDLYLTFGPLSSEEPTEDTYTYIFADGSKTTVTVDAGATPTAPANTPATTPVYNDMVSQNMGQDVHTYETYEWVKPEEMGMDPEPFTFVEMQHPNMTPCDFDEINPAVELIHTQDELQDGKTALEECKVCGHQKGGEVQVADHTWVEGDHIDATCLVQEHDTEVCEYCGKVLEYNFTGELADHKWEVSNAEPGTCLEKGRVEYTCTVCDDTKWEDGDFGPHTWVDVEEVAATCTEDGHTAGKQCKVCGETDWEVIPAGHSWREDAEVPSTCKDAGVAAGKTCTVCGATEGYEALPLADHTWREDAEVPATRSEAGVAAGKTCTVCGATEGYEVIPALGVDITVSGSSLGTVAINGEEIANATKNVPYASAYTLTATPADNAKFLGWKVGNKIVSDEATYTTSAFADMTYVPLFVETDSAAFTITFADSYGNVVATVESSELPLAELPDAPSFAGLTFTGWDSTLEDVNAFTTSTTVTAKYDNDAETTYKVTAPEGCTIIVDGAEVASPAEVTYNTLVTVKADDATAWTVNGSKTPAAYGSEYAFYCGSDIEVVPVKDAVDPIPAVKSVSYDKTATHQVTFLATRSVPEGFELVESGFVYGKAMTAADLVLDKVGKAAGTSNGIVKQIVCNNKGVDGQFALTYGVSAMNANASAAAYLIYRVGGKTVVIYSEAMIFDYSKPQA